MAITHYRPVRLQPVTRSAVRPSPWLGLLDDWFTPVQGPTAQDSAAQESAAQKPVVRVDRSDDGVTVHADLPGVRREDLDVSATPDGDGVVISLSAIRHLGNGEQSLRWSARLRDVDAESVSATLSDGVLSISAANRPGPVARSIEVSLAEPAEIDPVDPSTIAEDTASTEDTAIAEDTASTD